MSEVGVACLRCARLHVLPWEMGRSALQSAWSVPDNSASRSQPGASENEIGADAVVLHSHFINSRCQQYR